MLPKSTSTCRLHRSRLRLTSPWRSLVQWRAGLSASRCRSCSVGRSWKPSVSNGGVMEVFKKGSIEALLVPMRDRLGNISDLSAVAGAFYDVRKKSDNTLVQGNYPW